MSIDDMILRETHCIKLQGKWTTKKAVVALSDWFDFPSDLICRVHYDDDNDTTFVTFYKSKGEHNGD